jgi:polyphosphate kinase
MDVRAMEQLLRNLDRRVERIEQILPTLATKDELQSVESTLRDEIRAEGVQSRRHFDIVAESLRDDIRLIAEGQAALTHGVAAMRTELKHDIAGLDRRLTRLEAPRS